MNFKLDFTYEGLNKIIDKLNEVLELSKGIGNLFGKTQSIAESKAYLSLLKEEQKLLSQISKQNIADNKNEIEILKVKNKLIEIQNKKQIEDEKIKNQQIAESNKQKNIEIARQEKERIAQEKQFEKDRAEQNKKIEKDRIESLKRIANEEKKAAKEKLDADKKQAASEKEKQKAVESLNAQRTKALQAIEKQNAKEKAHEELVNSQVNSMARLRARTADLNKERDKVEIGTAKFKQLTKEIIRNEKELNKLGEGAKRNVANYTNSIKNLGSEIVSAFGFVGLITTAVTQLKHAFNVIVEFEGAMSNVKALTGATESDLTFFKEQAITAAQAVGGLSISARDYLEAIKLVAGAKPELLKNKEALTEIANQAIILAKASGLELPDAVRRLSDVMAQFNIPANGAADAVNRMAAASLEGRVEIPKLTEEIVQFGQTAKSAGLSLSQSFAIAEIVGAKGMVSFGEKIRNVLLNMQILEVKGKKMAVSLGINIDLLRDPTVNISEKFKQLSKHIENVEFMTTIFGKENIEAAKIMIQSGNTTNILAGKYDKLGVSMQQATDNSNNLAGAINDLGNSYDALILTWKSEGGWITAFLNEIKDIIDYTASGAADYWEWQKIKADRKQKIIDDEKFNKLTIKQLQELNEQKKKENDKLYNDLKIKDEFFSAEEEQANNAKIALDIKLNHEAISRANNRIKELQELEEAAKKEAAKKEAVEKEKADAEKEKAEKEKEKAEKEKIEKQLQEKNKRNIEITNELYKLRVQNIKDNFERELAENRLQLNEQLALFKDSELVKIELRKKYKTIEENIVKDQAINLMKIAVAKNEFDKKLLENQGKTFEQIIGKQLENRGKAGGKAVYTPDEPFLKEFLGLSDDEWTKLKDAWSEYQTFIKDNVNQLVDEYAKLKNADYERTEQAIENSKNLIAEKQSALTNEIELMKLGKANEVDSLQTSIRNEKERQKQLKKERDEALKDKIKADKIQLAVDSIMQSSNLITAATKIWEVTSSIPTPFGQIAAIAAIGTMFSAFAGQKAIAYKSIDSQKPRFAKGVIDLQGSGTGTSDSIDAKLSKGESVMTAKETQTSNYILKSIRSGKLNDEKLLKSGKIDTFVNDKKYLSLMEESVKVNKEILNEVSEKRYDLKDKIIIKKGNQTTIYQ